MTERRLPAYPAQPPHNNVLFTSPQWNNTGHHSSSYASSANHYLAPPYHNGVPHHSAYGPANPQPAEISYQAYSAGESYPSSGHPPSTSHHRSTHPMLNSAMTPPLSAGHGTQRQPHSPTHGRARSHSQPHHPYLPPQLSAHPHSTHPSPHVPFSQPVGMSSQYPATPTRPFSCDQCALSFNRQHDLKRHRETHTGEKPFLCNGGCGKTFTRKDALKRHQLVKQCGTSDQDDS
jgi:uncharacterized Zn-finger protein